MGHPPLSVGKVFQVQEDSEGKDMGKSNANMFKETIINLSFWKIIKINIVTRDFDSIRTSP